MKMPFKRKLASLPWTPGRDWHRSIVLAPLAVLFALDRLLRFVRRHLSALVALALLATITYALRSLDLFADMGFGMVFALLALGGLIAGFILVDWYRERVKYARFLSRRDDPREQAAVRRFLLVCEQAGFSPSAWHAGFDDDMFGLGVELYLKRLLVWKHGQAHVFPLDECAFAHFEGDLFIRVAGAVSDAQPAAVFRISCRGARRSAREWMRVVKRATRR